MNISVNDYKARRVTISLTREFCDKSTKTITNGNRTEWTPIRSVIIRVITKSDDRAAGVRFVNHEYDFIQIEVLLPINHKNFNFREKNSQVIKEKEVLHQNTCKGDENIFSIRRQKHKCKHAHART